MYMYTCIVQRLFYYYSAIEEKTKHSLNRNPIVPSHSSVFLLPYSKKMNKLYSDIDIFAKKKEQRAGRRDIDGVKRE